MQRSTNPLLVLLAVTVLAATSSAQSVPWDVFLDDQSASACDVVNTSNAELVVLSDTGELVVVTGVDLILDGTFVDGSGFVFVGGFPVGVIGFATDGDGFRTLWWTGLDGSVVEIDPFTGAPSPSAFSPSDFSQVPCDACELWDDPADCDGVAIVDSDLDGVDDTFDLCDNTPLDELADLDGCSCSQLDSDGDGIDDCLDLCPNTPLSDLVDDLGCGCSEFDDDGDGVEDCFDECPNTPFDELADDFGCSCSEYDSDQDGVDDCFDDCPNTPRNDQVDFDGCSRGDVVVVPPTPIVFACGNFTSLTMMTLLTGLCSIRVTRRRRRATIEAPTEDRP